MGKKAGRPRSQAQTGLHGFVTSVDRIDQLLARADARAELARNPAVPVVPENACAVGIGRALLSQDVVDRSLERLRTFGFTVQPAEGQIFVEYASASWLKKAGFSDVVAAYDAYMSPSSMMRQSLLSILQHNRSAYMDTMSFTAIGDVMRNIRLAGDCSKVESSSFSARFSLRSERASIGSSMNCLHATIGRVEVSDDQVALNAMVQEFGAQQSRTPPAGVPVVLGAMQIIYQAP